MLAATPVVIGFMGTTMLLSLYAFLRLSRSAPAPARLMASAVLGLLVLTAAVFLLSYAEVPPAAMTAVAVAPQLVSIWVAALLLHLLVLFRRDDRRWLPAWLSALVSSPAVFITALVAGVAVAIPGRLSPMRSGDSFQADFGELGPVIAAAGTFYLACSLAVLAALIRSGRAGARRELGLMFAFQALTLLDAPLVMWPLPGLPRVAVPLLFQSLTGIALAYAVIRECPLIVPRREERVQGPAPRPRFAPGTMHLYVQCDRRAARRAFSSMVRGGAQGLWVTRQGPKDRRSEYGLVATPFVWLTSASVEGELCIGPADTSRLSRALLDFLSAARDGIVLFEGLEYISSNVGFKGALNLVHYVNDRVMGSGGVLLVSIDAAAFQPEELALLRSEATGVHDGEEASRTPATAREQRPRSAGETEA